MLVVRRMVLLFVLQRVERRRGGRRGGRGGRGGVLRVGRGAVRCGGGGWLGGATALSPVAAAAGPAVAAVC